MAVIEVLNVHKVQVIWKSHIARNILLENVLQRIQLSKQ